MKVCPDTPTEDAAAPCVEAPRRRYTALWLSLLGLLLLAGGWWGLGKLFPRIPEHEPAKVNLATAVRTRAPVPLQAVGDIVRDGDAPVAQLRVQVPAEQGRGFFTVGTAEVRPRATPDRVYLARIKRTGEKDGKVFLEFEMDVADSPSLDDGRADVTIVPPGEAPILVPLTAVITRDSARSVAVVDAQGVLAWKVVTTGREYGSQVEVWGIDEGARYVQRADPALQEGAHVRAKRH